MLYDKTYNQNSPKRCKYENEGEDNIKSKLKTLIAFLTVLLAFSATLSLGNSVITKTSIEAAPLSAEKNYGDIMQYEWRTGGANENQDDFSAGPAPNTPNILWKTPTSAFGSYVTVFNGKAFIVEGGGFFGGGASSLVAFDPFTGQKLYSATLKGSGNGGGGVTKIDETYLYVDAAGVEVRRISDGAYVSNYTLPYYSGHPGSAQYFPGTWSSTLKMKYILSYDTVKQEGLVNAISLADPTTPKLAWTYKAKAVSEIQGFGDGKVFIGTTACTLYALDGATGALLWEAPKTGVVQQHGLYYDGSFYHAAASQAVTCWDGDTGEVLWEYDTNQIGERAYFAYRGAAGFGRYYDCTISNSPNGWVACWDAKTGELLWKQPGYYNIHYATSALADGKLYAQICDSAAGSVTAGLLMPGTAFGCFDAYTGTLLWRLDGIGASSPSIAYGNLYFVNSGYVYCIGDSTPTSSSAKDWSLGYVGNIEQPRVGASGPEDLSNPKWVYRTGGKVSSSAAVVNGKVYIGSDDHNLYCLNAYTGQKIWNFMTGYWVGASPAVVGGKVYTGADDGYFYCLNAETGQQIWKTNAGGLFDHIMMPQELQSRSSPIIVGDRLYAGALDGKVYCLRISDGVVQWTYTTGGPIGGSPAYSNGVIFIASTDTYMYALTASNGALKWKSIGINLDVTINPTYYYAVTGTPVVANGAIYIAAGATHGQLNYSWSMFPGGGVFGGACRMASFNESTGALIWSQIIAGNSGSVWVPTYFNGNLYIVEHMRVSQMNAANPNSGPAQPVGFFNQPAGNRTWSQWIGFQILSSVAYADDLQGAKVYVGSEVGSVSCLDASDGTPISAYQTGANVESSPTLWEGKLYIGSSDGNVYCFDDSPTVGFNIYAEASKGSEMWSNETIVIKGRLTSNPDETTFDGTKYVAIPSEMHPAVPSEQVIISFNKPDGSSLNLTATTDNDGYFTTTFTPTEVGNWGWVAFYEGKRTTGITYNAAYSQWTPINVVAAPSNTTPTSTPTPTTNPTATPSATTTPAPTASPEATATPTTANNLPMEYVYAGIAIVVIAVIAVAAYVYTKRKK